MKYTYECSEKEFTAVMGVFSTLIKEVAKVSKLKIKHASRRAAQDPVEVVQAGEDEDERDADVLPFRPAVVRRPTEQEVEDAIVNETEPLPEEMIKQAKLIALGERKFMEFIHAWLVGINMETMGLLEDVVQPNRELLLRDLCNSPFSFPVLSYVRSKGGLQRAIFAVTGDKALARRLPDFIVPPASIVFSDLADTYEYTNPWKDEE